MFFSFKTEAGGISSHHKIMADEVVNSHIKHKGIKHNSVIPWPHTDIDVTYTYNLDGTIASAELTFLGFTKTITYTYTDGKLTGKTTVIT